MVGESQHFLDNVSMLGSTRKTVLLTVACNGSGDNGWVAIRVMGPSQTRRIW